MTDNVFDPTIANEIPEDTIERSEAQFPIVQWHRGDPKMKKLGGMDYQGGWFVPENMAPADLTAYGWERTTWTHGEENETEGFYAREITVSVIRERKRWEVYDGPRRLNYAWRDYDKAQKVGRPSGRTHYLVLIQGLEEFGPFVLTLKGMAGMYFSGSRHVKGVLPQFDSVVIKAANDAVKRAGQRGVMPRRAFWLTVGAARDGKTNAPIFVEVGSGSDTSQIVPPQALGLPEKAEQVKLDEFFVGRDLLNRTTEIYREVEEWATAWDNIVAGSTEGEVEEAADAKPAAAVTEDIAEELGL